MHQGAAGTLTFLFTDIEGSTRLWEEQPEQMRADLARHDAILRAVIEVAAGHVFKTTGDGALAAFTDPGAAVEAAVAAQAVRGTTRRFPTSDGGTGHVDRRRRLHAPPECPLFGLEDAA